MMSMQQVIHRTSGVARRSGLAAGWLQPVAALLALALLATPLICMIVCHSPGWGAGASTTPAGAYLCHLGATASPAGPPVNPTMLRVLLDAVALPALIALPLLGLLSLLLPPTPGRPPQARARPPTPPPRLA